MKESAVQIKDGKLYFRQAGNGEPVILIHSIGLSGELWQHVIGPLSQKFTVYAIDLMGHGDSDKPDKCYEMKDFAGNIIEFMDKLGIKRARLVGSSIGAMISIEISATHPELVQKQVLVACPVFENAWERLESVMFMAKRYDENGISKPLTIEELRRGFYVNPTPEIVDWANRLRAKAGIWCKRDQITIGLWDIKPLFKNICCPTLIIFGKHDNLYSKSGDLQRAIKNSELAIMEDAAHFPMIDDPGTFINIILKFL